MNKSFQLTISGKKKVVTLVDDPVTNRNVDSSQPVHHILLIDGSGSMYGVSKEAALAASRIARGTVRAQDYLTVIRFHGVGDFTTLFQWSKVDQKVLNNIEALSEVHGTTCFSDPLSKVAAISSYQLPCDKTMLTILTDGCAVVPWSSEIETAKAVKSITQLASNTELVAVNTIGYGNYYNESFLRELSSSAGQGQFIHSSNIPQFNNLYDKIFEYAVD